MSKLRGAIKATETQPPTPSQTKEAKILKGEREKPHIFNMFSSLHFAQYGSEFELEEKCRAIFQSSFSPPSRWKKPCNAKNENF